ncbi:reverse transcriptase domain-containing protein [Lysinibacillus sp. LZ02]|uniref:reverse transcriptase domain-containing protein n=1 Tax=Lysinibacillus sp. LZ02 TaxID=3420668 RepID=UPI003D366DE1
MQVQIIKSDDDIKKCFNSLQSFEDVAILLEISKKVLWKNVIVEKMYYEFKIPKKKSGDFRVINKPSNNLDIIQKKLNYIISVVYTYSNVSSHGFEKGKSIRTNAEMHLKKKLVLNLDLKDFFSSINFPRVRAMFMTYFKFNNEVATTLANICCDNKNVLPQGAATSPIISNIIAYKLDKQLSRLAKKYGCVYTRYADDITFSTNRDEFHKSIYEHDEDLMNAGEKVKSIIENNGFKVNENKTRIYDYSKAQYVTGVKVNNKLNVNRSYIRRIRSILHTIDKNINDIEKARGIFEAKYQFRNTLFKNCDMFNVVRGMISHIGNIKGKQDLIFQKFAIRYNKIIKQVNEQQGKSYSFLYRPYTEKEFRQQNIFVIEEDEISHKVGEAYESKFISSQGSAFLLKGIGLVTNWHVIKPYIVNVIENELGSFNDDYYIPVTKSQYSDDIWFAKVIMYDKGRDLAVLEIEGIDKHKYGFNYSLDIRENMQCVLLGYPEYIRGQNLHEVEGKIQSQRIALYYPNNFVRYTTTMPIHGGNSGGPIVDHNNIVIAVAVKGRDNTVSEVIPIGDLLEAIDNQEMIKVVNHHIIPIGNIVKSL